MKIAFLTSENPLERRAWSGILYYMLGSLERHAGRVIPVGPVGQFWQFTAKCAGRAARLLFRYKIDSSHLVIVSRAMASIFERRLEQIQPEIVFAPVASTHLAFLNTQLPVVYYGDLTARLFRDYAANLVGLSKWSLSQLEVIERRALARADHVVYPSEWAADSAFNDYGVPQERISVVPMGANLNDVPSASQIAHLRRNRSSKNCRLLFIGVDWHRKGGDIALSAMRELRSRGIDASLTVVGCSPPAGSNDPHLCVIPFLDKSVAQDHQRLNELFKCSDFMLFPTRNEAFGVVCCEANAFGLPLIACRRGGVPIWTNENGISLEPEATALAYADAVQSLINDPDRYFQLALSGRRMFDTRLNWDAWGKSMSTIFERVLERRQLLLSRQFLNENHSPPGF